MSDEKKKALASLAEAGTISPEPAKALTPPLPPPTEADRLLSRWHVGCDLGFVRFKDAVHLGPTMVKTILSKALIKDRKESLRPSDWTGVERIVLHPLGILATINGCECLVHSTDVSYSTLGVPPWLKQG